jgi:hypothetical protein
MQVAPTQYTTSHNNSELGSSFWWKGPEIKSASNTETLWLHLDVRLQLSGTRTTPTVSQCEGRWLGDGAVNSTVPCSRFEQPTSHPLLGQYKGSFQNLTKHIIPEDGKRKCLPKCWKTFNLLISAFAKIEVYTFFTIQTFSEACF